MGLDTTHDCFHGPYSAFDRFRVQLAKAIGIDLHEMEGFTADGKSWDDVKHGIVPLLIHSDCDGELTVEECKQIVEGLNELIPNLHDNEYLPHSTKKRAIQFRDGCLKAIEKNENVAFG